MTPSQEDDPRFAHGQLSITEGVLYLIHERQLNFHHYLRRHLRGDFGDITDTEKRKSEAAIAAGAHIVSHYQIAPHLTLCVATHADRSHTLLTLAHELRKPFE